MLSFIVPSSFEFAFLQIFAGILLLYGMKTLAKRSQFFNAAVVIFLSYSATYLGLNIVQEGQFTGIHLSNYAWFGGNALLSMLAFPLIYFFERSFGFLSEISLLEISDSNNDLLRALSEKAPGTFQHTLQVANLAEEGIREIGGNVLLMRAGALYHDIGKMEAPQFFTENQHGINPHDDMGEEESARTIIHHVIKGIELARKHRLPEEVIDFIRSHHGTTRVEYFYRTAVNQRGEEDVDEALFRYPGPMPFSRETAVLMMADSVEAASRSLPDYSEERLNNLIESIVSHQQKMGQFENADITFKEITKVKKVFLKKLLNIYHSRIAYPDSVK
jgi:putative nucleotidyltransferase with HDIG domain